ncbi:AbrB/MazE/SpoVT family DNA-binding domain-containing protein [Ruegeria atlantica]|uniref:AbrB/MazE/SpoVT family DNA-binding domain-containing protein n=1 Tax=Ruegeria atlantica TaxID=81569 RepID=UPI001C2C29CD|nr:AbrB/MazE/SpoVT family DNA-binding domain-containing protein [Ruegeria atlantica]
MTVRAMHSKIGLWGGSCAVRLPKMAVESLGLKEGEEVSLQLDDGALVIRPARRRYALDQLVEQARAMTPPPALDDAPSGDEAL